MLIVIFDAIAAKMILAIRPACICLGVAVAAPMCFIAVIALLVTVVGIPDKMVTAKCALACALVVRA